MVGFYADLRWDGWRDEIGRVGLGEGLAIYPPLCTKESRPIGATNRRPVPWTELTALLDRLADVPDGAFRIRLDP